MAKRNGRRGQPRSGRGRAESVTGAKEAETEVRGAQVEMKMPQADRQLHYFDAIKGENAQIAKANERLKKIKAAAKSENVNVKAITNVLKMEKGDVVVYRQELEQQAILMREKGIPFQMTIHDIAFGSAVEQAKFEGAAAARAGRGPECRFPESSDAYDAYMEEYALVQAGNVPGADKLTDREKADAIAQGRQDKQPALAAH